MIEGEMMEGKGTGRRSGAGSRPRRAATAVALGFLIAATSAVAGYVLVEGRVGLYREGGQLITIQDFSSHTRFSGAVWSGDFAAEDSSLYTVDAHLRFMRDWAGEPVERALPFGYSPTMIWVLGPFAAVPLPVAYVLWTLAGLGLAAWIVLHHRTNALAALMVFLTPVAAASVALGQTAILSLGALFFLMDRSLRERDRPAGGFAPWPAAAAVLWALSGKPPLALTAGAALLALRDTRTVALGVALAALGTLALLPWMGTGWPADYIAMLSTYDRTQADPAFAWSLVPELMTNLRATLLIDLGVSDAVASRTGNLLWLAALVAVVWAGRTGRIARGGVWALAVLSYLVLCSHVSFTEDLLLLLVPAAVLYRRRAPSDRGALAAWLVVPAALVFNSALGPTAGVRPAPLFFVKLALVAWVLVRTVGVRSSPTDASRSSATTDRAEASG